MVIVTLIEQVNASKTRVDSQFELNDEKSIGRFLSNYLNDKNIKQPIDLKSYHLSVKLSYMMSKYRVTRQQNHFENP